MPSDAESCGLCYDCCDINFNNMVDCLKDMINITKAVMEIPCKGGKKVGSI